MLARAGSLGVTTDHLGAARNQPHRSPVSGFTPELRYLRDAAEPLVVAWLALRGLRASIPAEPAVYDLLLDAPGGIQRVQVKSTTRADKSSSWTVGIARHAGGGEKHHQRLPYEAAEVDLFAVLDGQAGLYLIPRTAVAGRLGINLRGYEKFLVGSAASLARLKPAPTGPPAVSRPLPETRPARPLPRLSPVGAPRGTARLASRWSPEDLRRSAAAATSWADMLRDLAYQPGTTKAREALRRDLQALGIDTSHFTGRRTWSDTALIEAAPRARTWAELCSALSLAPATGHYESVRRAAARLGVNLDHLSMGPRSGDHALGFELPGASLPRQLSGTAPSIAAAWFLLCGVAVSVPARPEPYDLIVQLSEGLKRVQVKSTTSRDSFGSWIIRVGHRPDGASTRADFIPYDADEVDLFLIVDGDLQLYLIPISEISGKASLSLRGYAEFIVGDASSLLARGTAAAADKAGAADTGTGDQTPAA